MFLKNVLSVTWKRSHLLVKWDEFLSYIIHVFFFLLFLHKFPNYQHFTVLLWRLSATLNPVLKPPSFHTRHMRLCVYCNPMQSCKVIQLDVYNLLIWNWFDAAWLHRRLSTHSVCLVVECFWPSIDSSYNLVSPCGSILPQQLKTECHPSSGEPAHTACLKFYMGDVRSSGNLIVPQMLWINLLAEHYSNQKHNLLNVWIHQPCHLC